MRMKLEYIGRLVLGVPNSPRMWNVFNSPRPDLHPDGSSIGEATIVKLLGKQKL
jgi:hypothetical protein